MDIALSKLLVIIVAIIVSIATVKTLIPNSSASKVCLLGYKATCTFAPISTVVLALVAVGLFVLAWRMV